MDILFFKIAIVLIFALFVLPQRIQYFWSLLLHTALLAISSFWAIESLFLHAGTRLLPFLPFWGNTISLVIDPLSAFFLLVVNFTAFMGILYAKGYLKPYYDKKNRIETAFHFFNFLGLHLSMLLVVMLRDAVAFLIAWELMSLSSFFLVIFESEKKETLRIGLRYLIQMHIGVALLIIAFIVAFAGSNTPLSFDGLSTYFTNHDPFWLFLLFFAGFGIKAGFIPLHSWLPHAHPAAPSHVSGVMSGVMIKMGIYGILRVLMSVHHDLFGIGLFILIISLISGLIGVSLAIVQHDVKKLLAYHSIENIGIIGIGIGTGLIGLAVKIPVLAVLGFAGGILHILNHSLFKSLLFFTSGNVYKQTHSRNIEQLGGLIKKMPKTAMLFLLGALAISGLPPFNGFISEFLIYSGMFRSLQTGGFMTEIVILFSFSGLAIIGGLAVFCFTKVFSIVFLGNPRSSKTDAAAEVENTMLIPGYLIGAVILFIGFAPALFMKPLAEVVSLFTGDAGLMLQMVPTLNQVSLSSGIFVAMILLFWALRAWRQKNQKVEQGITWGCGYSGADPALHQYTATSYAENFRQLSAKMVNVQKETEPFAELEIFPGERSFETRSSDIFEDHLVSRPTGKMLSFFEKIAVLQTGKIQHYLLYALVFLLAISVLTLLNLI